MMQPAELETDPNFSVARLSFKGNSWLFPASADAAPAQIVILDAGSEFLPYCPHRQLGHAAVKATLAAVIPAFDDHSFAKQDAK
jgi:hypothetical protein